MAGDMLSQNLFDLTYAFFEYVYHHCCISILATCDRDLDRVRRDPEAHQTNMLMVVEEVVRQPEVIAEYDHILVR